MSDQDGLFPATRHLRYSSGSSQSVSFSPDGNIDGMESLFAQGLASAREAPSTRGYSLLRWSLRGQQHEMYKFPMTTGAGRAYQQIAHVNDCPGDEACDIFLWDQNYRTWVPTATGSRGAAGLYQHEGGDIRHPSRLRSPERSRSRNNEETPTLQSNYRGVYWTVRTLCCMLPGAAVQRMPCCCC